MTKLAIVATLQIAQGRMQEFLPLLIAHRDRCLKDEPGTVRFDILNPRDDQNSVMLYEVYDDDAAFDRHWNGPNVRRIRAETDDMVLKLSGTRCSLVD